jgi:hypothetical protein
MRVNTIDTRYSSLTKYTAQYILISDIMSLFLFAKYI